METFGDQGEKNSHEGRTDVVVPVEEPDNIDIERRKKIVLINQEKPLLELCTEHADAMENSIMFDSKIESINDSKNVSKVDVHGSQIENYTEGEFEINSATGQSNFRENLAERSKDCEKGLEEHLERRASRSEVNFKVSLREEDQFEAEFSQLSDTKIISLKEAASGKDTEFSRNEFAKKENKRVEGKYEMPLRVDESHPREDLDRFAKERTNLLQDHPEIRSMKFAVYSEDKTNYTKGKSVIDLSKNETQSGVVEEDGKEESGPPPDVNSVETVLEARCMVSVVRSPAGRQGKEEEDLNAIIRRMIITELRKHREKVEAGLRRAHSDTESLTRKEKNRITNKIVPFGFKNQWVSRELREFEESQIKSDDDRSDEQLSDVFKERNVKQAFPIDETMTQNAHRLESPVATRDRIINVSIDTDNPVIDCAPGTTCFIESKVLLERKDNYRSFVEAGINEITRIVIKKALTIIEKKEDISKCTQTEHTYVIHAAKSCPLGHSRLSLHLQLHRLTSNRCGVSSKIIYTSPDTGEFIYRKASDNLIYEKSKASGSPSYIPLPERFRWRYVTPSKVK